MGKSIKSERDTLRYLNENMKFKGGPNDKIYASQIRKNKFSKTDVQSLSPSQRRQSSLNLLLEGVRGTGKKVSKRKSKNSQVMSSLSPDLAVVGGAGNRLEPTFEKMADIEEEPHGRIINENEMSAAQSTLINSARVLMR